MTHARLSIICLSLGISLVGPALAQPGAIETSDDPRSTEKAPNTTAVGQTKPPNRDASPATIKPIGRLTPRQAADDAITISVCVGCVGDPSTTGSIPASSAPARAPEKRDMRLDELRTAVEPKPQSDLDTVALASAHREQAVSEREKTNGLWQSWLVAICDGCGDQKPARSLKLEDWPNREGPATTGSLSHRAAHETAHHDTKRIAAPPHSSLEADLSPKNLDSIRRMPRR